MTERYTLIDHTQDNENHFGDKEKAQENKDFLEREGHEVEIVDNLQSGGSPEATQAEVVEGQTQPAPSELTENPIQWLESINTDFVNTIKGTPAISKQGFRYIQRQFEITTETELVQWVDDPTGCIVWAKAELPNGASAEAHGEGWQFESGVDDNEFVRYADTRAKNRALSDLTSAGALAVSELGGE